LIAFRGRGNMGNEGTICRAGTRFRPRPALGLALLILAGIQGTARPAAGQELGLEDSDAGYIDNAVVRNRIRFRFDAAYNNIPGCVLLPDLGVLSRRAGTAAA
jgi:hypothetical protein